MSSEILANSHRMTGRFCAVCAAVTLVTCAASNTAGQETASWLTGRALEARLATPVGVEWSQTPLGEALRNLGRAQQVAILVDRRVDPDQPLEASLRDIRLEEVFRQVAEHRGLGLCQFGPIAYFGPPEYTTQLRTLAAIRLEELRKLPAGVAQKFLRSQRLSWKDFAEPRALLTELASANGLEISGLEQVPHDLWGAADLPALSLADRLTLIAGQFDLTFQIAPNGVRLTLVPIPKPVTLERSYPGGRQPSQLLTRWRQLAPQSRIRQEGDRIVVEGLVEDHERIAASSRPASRPAPKPVARDQATTRFTVREARGPLHAMLQQLAGRLDLEMKIDRQALERAGISLEQNVAFSVEDATLDELLEAVLKPAGCAFHRQGKVVEIGPAP